MAYLNLSSFSALSLVPSGVISRVETLHAGWVDAQLEAESAWIDSRLAKKYATPFASPYPAAVTRWLSRIVSASVYDKHGAEALDAQSERIYKAADEARAEIKEAADAVDGLFDLPLRANTTASGISKSEPFGYSEQSPYVAFDLQRDAAWNEDLNGRGTGG